MADDPLVVRGDGDVGAAAEGSLDEPDVGDVDVALLRIGDRGRLQVRALDDAEVRLERKKALEVVARAQQVRLEDRPNVVVAALAQAHERPERGLEVLRLLHVDADERAQAPGMGNEPLHVRVCDLLVEGEPEVGQLERDVGPQLLGGDPIEDPYVLRDHRGRPLGGRDRLSEKRRVRVEARFVRAGGGRRCTRRASRRRRTVLRRAACRTAGRAAPGTGCPRRAGSRNGEERIRTRGPRARQSSVTETPSPTSTSA